MRRKRRQQTGDRADRGWAEEPRSKKRWGHPPEFRIRVVREVLDGHMTRPEAARVFGVAVSTIADWMRRYRARGMDGLRGERRGPPAGTKPGSVVKREAVTAVRREHPEYGTQRVSDMLRRFEGLGVSETEVRRCSM